MTRKLLSAALLLACPALAAAQVVWKDAQYNNIKIGDITVVTPVTGVSTAQETFDVFSPFDGRVEELHTELFRLVTPKTVLARMVSAEMAALLDSSPRDSRKQTERRWQDIYKYTDVKPDEPGVVTNIYVGPGTKVNKGDRMFTVARKVVIVGRNTLPLYSALSEDMEAEMVHARTKTKFRTSLTSFLPIKDSPRINRLWLEVQDLGDGIRIGEQFDGILMVGESKNAMLIPRKHMIEAGGRMFLITEVKPALQTKEEIEVVGHSSVYLAPPEEKRDGNTAEGKAVKKGEEKAKDGKTKKDR